MSARRAIRLGGLGARYLHWARVANVRLTRRERRRLHAEADAITRRAASRHG